MVDLNEPGVRAVAEEITAAGGEAHGIAADLHDTARLPALVDAVVRRFGGLDILVNNAGVSELALRPEEVAQVTLSLVLPASSYLNGAVIPVDGGLRVQNT